MTPREAWILENLAPPAASAAEREGASLSPEEAFTLFRAADPSRNASATAWLLGAYVKEGFRLEDLAGGASSKAAETLEAFARHRGRLPPVERSLNRYAALGDLWAAVEPFERIRCEADEASRLSNATGRERRRLERERARRESVILREDEECTIAVPLTLHAARWWGKGTRWCTAAEKNSMFSCYDDSPLVVVTYRLGRRIQMHANDDTLQIMDEADRPLSKGEIEVLWPEIGFFLLWASERMSGVGLGMVPDRHVTRAMCLAHVAGGRNLGPVPERFVDDGFLTDAVRLTPGVMLDIHEARKTPVLCRLAVEKNPEMLPFVPRHLVDEDLCRTAVMANGGVLRHVPEAMRTAELCRQAVRSSRIAIQAVPRRLMTPDLVEAAIRHSPAMMAWLPGELVDDGLWLLALRSSGRMLGSMPPHLVTAETCRMAVEQDGTSIGFVPERLLDDDLCWSAIRETDAAVLMIPGTRVTREMCLHLVREGRFGFTLPLHLADRDTMTALLDVSPEAIRVLPSHATTDEMVRYALSRDGLMLGHLSRFEITEEHCRTAIANSEEAARYVPARFRWLLEEDGCGGPVVRWKPDVLDDLRNFIAAVPPAPSDDDAPSLPLPGAS